MQVFAGHDPKLFFGKIINDNFLNFYAEIGCRLLAQNREGKHRHAFDGNFLGTQGERPEEDANNYCQRKFFHLRHLTYGLRTV